MNNRKQRRKNQNDFGIGRQIKNSTIPTKIRTEEEIEFLLISSSKLESVLQSFFALLKQKKPWGSMFSISVSIILALATSTQCKSLFNIPGETIYFILCGGVVIFTVFGFFFLIKSPRQKDITHDVLFNRIKEACRKNLNE